MKPMRNLDVSAGDSRVGVWAVEMVRESCVGVAVAGVGGPLTERKGCPGDDMRAAAAGE